MPYPGRKDIGCMWCDNKPLRSRGLCNRCYKAKRRNPDAYPDFPLKPYEIARRNAGVCQVDECERSARSRGFCAAHYMRWLRGGELSGKIRKYEPRPDTNGESKYGSIGSNFY